MKVIVQLSSREELKALPIIYRHSPAMVLPEGKYVLNEGAVTALREAGVKSPGGLGTGNERLQQKHQAHPGTHLAGLVQRLQGVGQGPHELFPLRRDGERQGGAFERCVGGVGSAPGEPR